MKVVVLANAPMKAELTAQATPGVVWLDDVLQLKDHLDASVIIDLLFQHDEVRIAALSAAPGAFVIINNVEDDLSLYPSSFARINGWPGFLQRSIAELAASNDNIKNRLEQAIQLLGKTPSWVPDIPGFVSARVVAMMINEAYLSLDEQVSTKADIDTAMKLGTNYPYGPFEWASIIGAVKVHTLLKKMEERNAAYAPAAGLSAEVKS